MKSEKSFNLLLIVLLLGLTVALLIVNPINQVVNHQIISWDAAGYYLYLPSAFIYHDFKNLDYIPTLFHQYEFSSTFYQAFKVDNGNYVMNYYMGTAILQMPFFLVAHCIALFSSYPADGFSIPYQFMIVVAGLFYGLSGSLLLYKLLIKYFEKILSLTSVGVIFLGTNLYNYSYTEPCMSHVYLFFLISSMLFLSDKWYRKVDWKNSLLLGLAVGLIIISRPTVAIVLIIPLLWEVNSYQKFIQNLNYVFKHWKYLMIAVTISLMPIIILISYWKYVTGLWLFNTYGYTHLGFNFHHPHLYDGLFSIRKSWFIYTPMVLLMLSGFLLTKNYKRFSLIPILLYIIADVYIVFSWQVWDYGGGLGARALVDSYAALAFPFTGLINSAYRNKILRTALFTLIGFFCVLNLFQTWQYSHSIFDTTGIISKYEYRKQFFNPVRDLLPLSYLDESELVRKPFLESSRKLVDTTYASPGEPCNWDHPYVNALILKGRELKALRGNRLRYTFNVSYEDNPDLLLGYQGTAYIIYERDNNAYLHKLLSIPSSCKVNNPCTKIFELQIPEVLRDNDVCKLFLAAGTSRMLRVYQQKVELLQTKE